MWVVHSHFHRRRTGVTSHTEQMVLALSKRVQAFGLGQKLAPDIPRLNWSELFRRSRKEGGIWHAHRNHELLIGVLLRLMGCRLTLVFTRHDVTRPGAFTRFVARLADAFRTPRSYWRLSLALKQKKAPLFSGETDD